MAQSEVTGGGRGGVGTQTGGAAVQDDKGGDVHGERNLKWGLGFVECNMAREIESVCR